MKKNIDKLGSQDRVRNVKQNLCKCEVRRNEMTVEEYIKKEAKKISKKLKKKYDIDYLDVCFMKDYIGVTDADDIRFSSHNGGETWQTR